MSLFAFIGTIGLNLALSFSDKLARTVPTNYVLLGLFTLLESLTLSFYVSAFDSNLILVAALLTTGTCIGLFIYALTTTKELTYFFGMASSCASVVFFMALWGLFVGFGSTMHIIYLLIGTAMCSLYLVMDLKLIIGGGRFEVSLDDYIRACMRIYMDIILLFMKILRIL